MVLISWWPRFQTRIDFLVGAEACVSSVQRDRMALEEGCENCCVGQLFRAIVKGKCIVSRAVF